MLKVNNRINGSKSLIRFNFGTFRNSLFILKVVLIILYLAFNTFSFDNYQSQFRSPLSSVSLLHAVSSNPALLAAPGYPTFGLQFPFPASLTLQFSNSDFSIPNPIAFFLTINSIDRWIARILIESFQLEGLSPEMVSSRMSSLADKDLDMQFFAETPYLKIATKKSDASLFGWGFDLRTFIDGNVTIPGQAFNLIFSTENGLQPGNSISFEALEANTEVITEIKGALAQAFDVSINLGNRALFNHALFGLGVTQRFGHTFYSLIVNNMDVDYKERGVLNIHGDFNLESSGINSDGNVKLLGVNGYGLELSTGAILQNDHIALSSNLNNVGFMSWYKYNQSRKIVISNDTTFLYDLLSRKNDSLLTISTETPKKITYALPTSISGLISAKIPIKEQYHAISTYQLISLGGQLSSTKIGRFGRGYAFSFNVESGFDYGKLPFRIGWTYTQQKIFSSMVSLELSNRQLTYDIWYRAEGDWMFRPRKGAEIGFCFHVYTGFDPSKKIIQRGFKLAD